jgi:hypothetical protein
MIKSILEENYERLQVEAVLQAALWIIPVIATLIDLWTGVEAAKARGENIHSQGLRETIKKYGDYWRIQVMAMMIDLVAGLIPQYNLPFASMLVAVSIVAIETRSVIENMRSKKSQAADIPEVAREILNCKNIDRAKELITKIKGNGTN